ncbi:MAG TPA: GGDEF domain-containing protein [Thermoanaerobaculia bacterium]|nr:GGDEF domain-containing protein [Thermoanaerobaculia bacterium]
MTLAAIAAVAVIGWLDYVTGPDIGVSLFYLIPIAVCAWFAGLVPAVIVACIAGTSWLTAELLWPEERLPLAIPLWNAFTRLVIFNSEGILIALLHRDRERFRLLAERESELARTDKVTQLPNLRGFAEEVEVARKRAVGEGRPLGLIYLDLDNFKAFNDLLGHAAGDLILAEVAAAVTRALAEGDAAARIGGDEFAVLLVDADEETARATAQTIVDGIHRIGAIYHGLQFGATAGIAYFRNVPATVDALLHAADEVMYRGKAEGKGTVTLQVI